MMTDRKTDKYVIRILNFSMPESVTHFYSTFRLNGNHAAAGGYGDGTLWNIENNSVKNFVNRIFPHKHFNQHSPFNKFAQL